jgi:hypothetical protein
VYTLLLSLLLSIHLKTIFRTKIHLISCTKKAWSFGDTKTDRKGRAIYFIGYSSETDAKGNQIEFWEPEAKFLTRKLDQ